MRKGREVDAWSAPHAQGLKGTKERTYDKESDKDKVTAAVALRLRCVDRRSAVTNSVVSLNRWAQIGLQRWTE